MASPRAVVIPFAVPDDGRGLGLGLAALVHSFAQIDGESVALAQLLSRAPNARRASVRDEDDDADDDDESVQSRGEAGPVEAFVPPRAWKDLTGSSADPTGVSLVVTRPATGDLAITMSVPPEGETRGGWEALTISGPWSCR